MLFPFVLQCNRNLRVRPTVFTVLAIFRRGTVGVQDKGGLSQAILWSFAQGIVKKVARKTELEPCSLSTIQEKLDTELLETVCERYCSSLRLAAEPSSWLM